MKLGWNAAVPPNGFSNRPREDAYSNDNPRGLATPVGEMASWPYETR